MAGDRTEQALKRLRELETEESGDGLRTELRAFFPHRSNHVVARAARLAAEWRDEADGAPLAKAFERFMKNPVKTDPGCVAKRAIIEALVPLGHSDPACYLAGARHVQMEPAFVEKMVEDTAPGLRAASGRALLLMHYPEAYTVVIDLVNDTEVEARRLTVDALAEAATHEAELLLRMKAAVGDEDIDVMAGAFDGLMTMAGETHTEFVAGFLDGEDDALAQAAAFALGQSRLSEALGALCDAHRHTRQLSRRDLLLLPIALNRSEEAFAFLIEAFGIETNPGAEWLDAFRLFAADDDKARRIRSAFDAASRPDWIPRLEED